MKLENIKTQMRKGILEYCILNILAQDEAYVGELLDKLKKAELIVVEGTIYPLMTRLKNAGLLAYRWQESTGGPPRKYYQLTDKGEEFLDELSSTWDGLKNSIDFITTQNSQDDE